MPNTTVMLNNNEGFVCDAAAFDGATCAKRGAALTGIADSKSGIFVASIRLDGGDGTEMCFFASKISSSNYALVRRGTGNKIVVGVYKDPQNIVLMNSISTYASGSQWIRIAASWNVAVPVGNEYVSVNDVSDPTFLLLTDLVIPYESLTDWAIGSNGQASTGSFLTGALAEVYFAPGQYLDFSVEANIRKFFGIDGRPVFLGIDGSIPTGTAPLCYHHLDDGEDPENFALNRGTGGDFASITGTITTASTSPSD